MIAADGDDLDAGAGKALQFADQELAGPPILPVAIVKIAGDQDHRDLLVERKIHQLGKCRARSATNAVGGRIRVRLQPTQRAVKMQVGAMENLIQGRFAFFKMGSGAYGPSGGAGGKAPWPFPT